MINFKEGVFITNPEISTLITRKQKADTLAPEIRQRYAEEYTNIVLALAKHAVIHSLPAWDEDVNSVILTVMFWNMGQRYDQHRPYIEWMCSGLLPEVDESWRVRDQARFYRAVMAARGQLGNV